MKQVGSKSRREQEEIYKDERNEETLIKRHSQIKVSLSLSIELELDYWKSFEFIKKNVRERYSTHQQLMMTPKE